MAGEQLIINLGETGVPYWDPLQRSVPRDSHYCHALHDVTTFPPDPYKCTQEI